MTTTTLTEPIETTAQEGSVSDPGVSPDPEPNPLVPAIPGDDLGLVLDGGRVPVGAAPRGVVPTADELRTLASLAVAISGANVGVPRALQGHPNDVLAVFLAARDLGMALTTALREFHIIEGKVTLSPKVRLAATREIGKNIGWRIWPDKTNSREKAVWYGQRPEYPGETFASEFTWADAQEAELASWDCTPTVHTAECRKKYPWSNGKQNKPDGICKDNWRKYPARMLSWRAAGYLEDDLFGEVGTGLYSPDELGAITDEDGRPVINVSEVAAPEGMGGSAPSGSSATPPGVAMASPEKLAEVKARLDALPDAGKQTMLDWWAQPKDSGEKRRPLMLSTAADMIAVMARLAQVEKAVADGVFAAPVATEGPLEVTDQPIVLPAVGAVPGTIGQFDIQATVKAEVAGMDQGTVGEYLTTLGKIIPKSDKAARAMLEVALIAERVEAKWKDQAESEPYS